MGAWGAGIFSNDEALDVRADFREHIGDGLSTEQATAELLKHWGISDADVAACATGPVPIETGTVILALAATQWELGRLQAPIRDAAVAFLDRGGDVHEWADSETRPGVAAKRKAALIKVREKLLSPQPKVKKLKAVFRERSEWELGQIIAYRLLSGQWVLMRGLWFDETNRQRIPIMTVCDWIGPGPPQTVPADLRNMHSYYVRVSHALLLNEVRDPVVPFAGEALARWRAEWEVSERRRAQLHHLENETVPFAIYSQSARDYPADRVRVVGLVRPEKAEWCSGCYFGGWKRLDGFLKNSYGIE